MVNASFAHLLGALASGDGWRSWRPSDPPFPAMRGEVCAQDGELRFAARRRSSAAAQIHPMCLARDDLISNAIRRKGRWCALCLAAHLREAACARAQTSTTAVATPLLSFLVCASQV